MHIYKVRMLPCLCYSLLADELNRGLTYREETGCSFIENSILAKKKLSLFLREPGEQQDLETWKNTHESLRAIQLGVCDETNSPATPIVSLGNLMNPDESQYHTRRVSNTERFSTEDRNWLCLNLALSLLHMPGHLWTYTIWDPARPDAEDGIFFLRDPRTQKIIDKTRPYMSWQLYKEPKFRTSAVDFNIQLQTFKIKLLGFARLLMEIHAWKKFHALPGCISSKFRHRLLSHLDGNFNSKGDLEFISAMRACLNHAGCIEAAVGNKPERFQSYIFENIVKPLHRYLGNPELPRSIPTAMPSYDQAVLDGSNQLKYDKSLYDSFTYNGEHEEKGSVLYLSTPSQSEL